MTISPVDTHVWAAQALEETANVAKTHELKMEYFAAAQVQATFALLAAILELPR